MEAVILFLSEKNPAWAFVKPVSTTTDGIIDQYEGGWLEFSEPQPVKKVINLKGRYLSKGFWLRKGE